MTFKKLPARDLFGRFKAAKEKAVQKAEPKQISIKELFEKNRYPNLFIQLPSATLPAVRNQYGIISYEKKLKSDVIMLESITDYYDYYYISFIDIDGKARDGSYIAKDAVVSIYKGKADADLEALKEKFAFNNLHNKLNHQWKIGSKPEIFVEDAFGTCLPAFSFLGSKEKPNKSPRGNFEYGGTDMYANGFGVKAKTKHNDCLGWHMDSIAAVMRGVSDASKKQDPKSKLSIKSVFNISKEAMASATDEQVAIKNDCLNVYGLKPEKKFDRKNTIRTVNGNIVFGIGKTTEKKAAPIVKALDGILAVACVSLFDKIDDPKRRLYSGLPGDYKLHAHGIEYNVLSNAWLSHPMISNLVIDFARKVVMLGEQGFYTKYWKSSEEEVLDVVLKCDVKKARKILERNKELLLKLFKAAYPWADDKQQNGIFNIFMGGITTAIKDPTDFVSNWTLDGAWVGHSGGTNKNVEGSLNRFLKSGNLI